MIENISVNHSLAVFSDIHGSWEDLKSAFSRIKEISPNKLTILFVGDAIDCWFDYCSYDIVRAIDDTYAFEKYFDSNVDSDGKNLTNSLQTMKDHAIKKLDFKGVNYIELRKSIIGGIKAYNSLKFLSNDSSVTFLLGNHEVDLLSGGWYYRSLQKCILLNLLGFNGYWNVEFKDRNNINKQLNCLEYSNISELHDLFCNKNGLAINMFLDKKSLMLKWLFNRPVIAQYGANLFMHGGPTVSFLSEILKSSSVDAFRQYLNNQKDSLGLRSPFFCEYNNLSNESFLAPIFSNNHFQFNDDLTDNCLRFFNAKCLYVGHSPYLNKFFSNQKKVTPEIFFLTPKIVKLDVGLKKDYRYGLHFLILDETSQYHQKVFHFENGNLNKIYSIK